MSQAGLPVNQDGPGLTVVFGWSSEERRARGAPASVQGIDFCASSGKVLSLDFCPWCGAKIASSATSVRAHGAGRERARIEPPVVVLERAAAPAAALEVGRAPSAATPHAPAETGSGSLKLLRERLGLSQAELGEKLGLARSSVANYENGRSPLSQRLLKWIAKHEGKVVDRTERAAGSVVAA
jgi:DNA-binding XRE family transcriptional regulator